VADPDLGQPFALAALAEGLADYESFNVCGADFPSSREVIEFIAGETDSLRPWYRVPYFAGYSFAWLMEKLNPILPGSSLFLTRFLVHVTQNWFCPSHYASQKIGYVPQKQWRTAVQVAVAELKVT
jgi:hypothetical protein